MNASPTAPTRQLPQRSASLALGPYYRVLYARVRRELLRAGRPLTSRDLAHRLDRRCARPFIGDVAYLSVLGKVRLTPDGYVLAR